MDTTTSMLPFQFNRIKSEKKPVHDRSLQENLLLHLKLNDGDLLPLNHMKETEWRSELFYFCQQLDPLDPGDLDLNLLEDNILNSIDIKVTELTFDITKPNNEHRGLLTGVTDDIKGSTFAVVKNTFHCNKCSEKGMTVTFAPGYDETMDSTKPYVPLNVGVQRAFIMFGCTSKRVMIDCHPIDKEFSVCQTDALGKEFLVAPTSINTHSLGFFLKFSGFKKINHVFDVTKVNQELFRKYLILMTLTFVSRRGKYDSSFLPYTIFPLSSQDKDPIK